MSSNKRTYNDGSEQKDRIRAGLGTFIFYAILGVIFLFFGLTVPLPLPEEQGAFVMLGETDFGNDYSAPQNTPEPEPQISQPQPQSTPEPVDPNPEIITTKVDVETPAVTDTKKTEPQKEDKPKSEQKTDNPKNNETTEPTKEERKSNPLFEFNKSDNKTPGKGSGAESGNQGSKNGNPNSKNPGKGGNGFFGYNLKGRGLVQGPPAITGENQRPERIVFEITVNKSGQVIRAVPTIKNGGTLTTGSLVNEARQAVMKMRFTSDANAFDEQTGIVTFNVKPQ